MPHFAVALRRFGMRNPAFDLETPVRPFCEEVLRCNSQQAGQTVGDCESAIGDLRKLADGVGPRDSG